MKKTLITLLVILVVGGLIFGGIFFLWTAENLLWLGDRSMAAGDYSQAAFWYEQAATLEPDDPAYVLALADACIADGSYTMAERSLVKAINKAPSAELYCKLSSVYVVQDKLLDAQEMLDNVRDEAISAQLEAMRPAAPVLTYPAGEYDEYIDLTFEAAEGRIYYSFDEQYPSLTDAEYTEPVALATGSTALTAIVVGENGLVSPLLRADYLIVGVVEPVEFASPELEEFVRSELYVPRTASVMTSDLWTFRELTVPDNVTVFTDLAYFTGLTSLTLTNSNVTDYSFLASLTELRYLDLTGCIFAEDTMEYVAGLSNLETLLLSGCGLSNIEALAANSRLTTLDLSNNSISNISVLADLPRLEVVNLGRNAITSLAALEEVDSLISLDISENDVISLDPLKNCTKLETLLASGNRIASLEALASMPDLSVLTASNNALSDVSVLAACTKLTRLELSDNALTSIDVVAGLLSLTYLDISYNQITVLPELDVENACFQQINAAYNQIEDVSMLAGLRQLTYLNLDYNENLEEIECLTACRLLVQIDAFGTKVQDVTLLTDMGVIVNYNPVVDQEN